MHPHRCDQAAGRYKRPAVLFYTLTQILRGLWRGGFSSQPAARSRFRALSEYCHANSGTFLARAGAGTITGSGLARCAGRGTARAGFQQQRLAGACPHRVGAARAAGSRAANGRAWPHGAAVAHPAGGRLADVFFGLSAGAGGCVRPVGRGGLQPGAGARCAASPRTACEMAQRSVVQAAQIRWHSG